MTDPPSPGDGPRGATVIASLTNGSPWTRPLPNKVAEVSLTFWPLTILSTTVGATAADFLSTNPRLGMSATTAIMGLVAASSLIWQLSTGRYVAGSYWLAVLLVSVFATLLSVDLVDNLGVNPWAARGIFCTVLVVAFTGWHRSGCAPPVHSVLTRQREAWYWFVVLGAFSLGTSMGDLISEKPALGITTAGLVFFGVVAVPSFARHNLRLVVVAAFWAAYVRARPLGAAIGDLLTAAPRDGGLGLRSNATSASLLVVMLVVVSLFDTGGHRSGQ
jgi:uncharacterized membrane-anchored protein